MHTCYKIAERTPHPELGAMVARYLGRPADDLPSFVRMGASSGNAGSGYLGPQYEPFTLGRDGSMPYFTTPYLKPDEEQRRGDLLRFMEQDFAREHPATPFESHRLAKEKSWRLLRAKGVFNIRKEWPAHRDRYGDTDFGRSCFMARKLVEAGVPFVEVGQDNYDSHADNFVCHKANMSVLDPAWSSLLHDLAECGLLNDTLIVWMGEVGRTPYINNRAGRDHFIRAKKMYLAAAAYSLDGKVLALGRGGEANGNTGKVFLFDPATGKKLRELGPGHQDGLTDLAFHPDGKHLASCGRDTVVRIWDMASGKMVKELGKGRGGQFKDWVHAISFSADGRWLAAADMAGTIQVWTFPT